MRLRCSVCVCVYVSPIVARQQLGNNPLIVARQRLGKISVLLLGNDSVEMLQQ
jgi:hypothetical protein